MYGKILIKLGNIEPLNIDEYSLPVEEVSLFLVDMISPSSMKVTSPEPVKVASPITAVTSLPLVAAASSPQL